MTQVGVLVELSLAAFDRIRRHIEKEVGLSFADNKQPLFRSRLAKRLRELGLDSFEAYADLLTGGTDTNELSVCLNMVTTNLTSFFREIHHFEELRTTFLPALMAEEGRDRVVRIWSAACSTGAEPYTLAVVVRDALASHPGWSAEILASDLNTEVLGVARRAVYTAEEVKGVSSELLHRHFQRGTGEKAGRYRVRPAIARMVDFQRINLLRPLPRFDAPFDVVFCRNCLIYFSKEKQAQVIHALAETLRPGGLLFLGHSESVPSDCTEFERLPRTVYRKRGARG